MASLPTLRRRDLLKLGLGGIGLVAAVKVVGRVVVGVEPLTRTGPALTHLTARQAATVLAAVGPMLGTTAESARLLNQWDPAAAVDRFFDLVPPDQRALLGTALALLEEWTLGLSGFSRQDAQGRADWLEAWRTSGLAVHRSTWGFLHAALSAAWAATPLAWEAVDYPGPCVPSGLHRGRRPGQSVPFDWDPAVP